MMFDKPGHDLLEPVVRDGMMRKKQILIEIGATGRTEQSDHLEQ